MESQRQAWVDGAGDWRHHADSADADPFYWALNRPAFIGLLPEPGELTVEIGAGNGRLTTDLLVLGHRVVASDIAETSVAQAAGRADAAHHVVCDATRRPLRTACAEIVVAFMCLQDFDDMRSAVSAAGRSGPAVTRASRSCIPSGRAAVSRAGRRAPHSRSRARTSTSAAGTGRRPPFLSGPCASTPKYSPAEVQSRNYGHVISPTR